MLFYLKHTRSDTDDVIPVVCRTQRQSETNRFVHFLNYIHFEAYGALATPYWSPHFQWMYCSKPFNTYFNIHWMCRVYSLNRRGYGAFLFSNSVDYIAPCCCSLLYELTRQTHGKHRWQYYNRERERENVDAMKLLSIRGEKSVFPCEMRNLWLYVPCNILPVASTFKTLSNRSRVCLYAFICLYHGNAAEADD